MTNPPENAAPANNAGSAPPEDCVANLPYARGAVFCGLDEYLAHLENQGAIDLPWWRQMRPGVYERVVRMAPQPEREIATREELMRLYGFRR